jgi:hypothetical protein
VGCEKTRKVARRGGREWGQLDTSETAGGKGTQGDVAAGVQVRRVGGRGGDRRSRCLSLLLSEPVCFCLFHLPPTIVQISAMDGPKFTKY